MGFSSLLLCFPLLLLIFLLSALYFLNILPLVRTLPLIIKNSNRVVDWAVDLLLASPTGTVTVFPLLFTADPQNVHHISKSHFHNYPKSSAVTATFHDFIGDGIINVNGEQWKLQRKMASYQFSASALRAFAVEKVPREVEERLVPVLETACATGEALDLQDVLERFAFDSVCSLVFGYDYDCLSKRSGRGERLYRAFEEAADLSVKRIKLPFSLIWKLKKVFDVGSERRMRESMAIVKDYFAESLSQSKKTDAKKNIEKRDFLSQFAKHGEWSNELLRDILINFVVAGRDTTPSALTWFFWVISSRPDVVGKILEELRLIRASQEHGKSFTLDSIREMHYLHAAISESMRLYPPVSLLTRECKADDTLPDGTEVKKGWMVMYSPMAMGRMRRLWGEDCAEFRPERWLVDGVFRPRNPFEYPVFHSGPRMCLGKEMAYVQMKAVAASILERLEMEVVEERGRHEIHVTLRMEGGLPVRVRERN